jgi:lipopolysaccharide export LptBFGC system permease protein LptF
MAALALLLLAHALSARKDGQTSSPPSNPAAPPPQEARRRIGVTVAALALSVALLQFLGFPLTVFLFLLLMFRFVEPQPLIRSLVLSLLFATVLVFVFQVLLRVPFPHGILGM